VILQLRPVFSYLKIAPWARQFRWRSSWPWQSASRCTSSIKLGSRTRLRRRAGALFPLTGIHSSEVGSSSETSAITMLLTRTGLERRFRPAVRRACLLEFIGPMGRRSTSRRGSFLATAAQSAATPSTPSGVLAPTAVMPLVQHNRLCANRSLWSFRMHQDRSMSRQVAMASP